MSISGPEVAQNLCVTDDDDPEGVDVCGEDDNQSDQFIFLLPSPSWDTVQLDTIAFLFVVHGEGDRNKEGHYWNKQKKKKKNHYECLLN